MMPAGAFAGDAQRRARFMEGPVKPAASTEFGENVSSLN
jgi:hypothetical protein